MNQKTRTFVTEKQNRIKNQTLKIASTRAKSADICVCCIQITVFNVIGCTFKELRFQYSFRDRSQLANSFLFYFECI